MLLHPALPCRTLSSRSCDKTSYAVHAQKRSARREARVGTIAATQDRITAAPAAAQNLNTQVDGIRDSELEQSSTVTPTDILAQRNGRDSSDSGSSSPSATLFGALVQSALSQATNQLQRTLEQVNKLTKGFQPRPEGYPPGLIYLSDSFALVSLEAPLNCP